MDNSLSLEIAGQLASYLAGATPFDPFQDWLVGTFWRVDESDDTLAADLAYHIFNRVAEYTGGYITEDQLKSVLRADLQEEFPALAAQLLVRPAS